MVLEIYFTMHRKFITELNKIHPISNEKFLDALESLVQVQKKPKHSILLNEGDYSNKVLFLFKGLARAFYYEDGDEVTSWIIPENNFIICPSSFFTDQVSQESIQLLEDSIISILSKKDFQNLKLTYPEAASITIRVMEKFLVHYDKRVKFLRLPVQKRLERFEEEYPNIIYRVNAQHLSTFLGISKSSLSHIRAQK